MAPLVHAPPFDFLGADGYLRFMLEFTLVPSRVQSPPPPLMGLDSVRFHPPEGGVFVGFGGFFWPSPALRFSERL